MHDLKFLCVPRYSKDFYKYKANYISNPHVKFMGERTGSWDEDNARVLTETRFRSAAVGDESATISESQYLNALNAMCRLRN